MLPASNRRAKIRFSSLSTAKTWPRVTGRGFGICGNARPGNKRLDTCNTCVIQYIFYSIDFVEQLRKLPRDLQQLAIKKEKLFKQNPLHPSLRLHGLKGKLKGHFQKKTQRRYCLCLHRQARYLQLSINIGAAIFCLSCLSTLWCNYITL